MLRFGEFTLDTDNRMLWRKEAPVSLEPKVFDCLELLAHRSGELTSLAELRRTLWPRVQVGHDALRRVIAGARKALGDSGRRQAWIKTRNGVGYVFVAEVARVGPACASEAEACAPGEWPFVGRHPELTVLGEALEAAVRAGRGSTCLVAGAAGSGKTQLLWELRQRAVRAPCHWLVGHCHAGAAAAPFWPFGELAEQILDDPGLRAKLSGSGDPASLEGLRALRGDAVSPLDDASVERLRRCERFVGALCRLAAAQPLCVVVEDLHWADEGSLLLLELLCRRSRNLRLCILATYRSEKATGDGSFGELVGRLSGRPGVMGIEMAPLGFEEIDLLLERHAGARGCSLSAEELLRLTGGNPLFVRQLVTHVSELQRGSNGAFGRLPQSLQHTVRERVSTLPRSSRSLLGRAAVVGERFAVPLLAELAGRPVPDVRGELQPALAAGLLREEADQPDSLGFCHGLVRDCLYQDLPGPERQGLHRAAVVAWERMPAGPRRTSAMAHHAYLAAESIPVARTRALCERAGRSAFDSLAFDQAAVHLKRALTLANRQPLSEQHAALSLQYARAVWQADHPSAEVTAAFEASLDLARRTAAPLVFAEAAIGLAVGVDSRPYHRPAWYAPVHEVAMLEHALGMLPDSQLSLRRRICSALSWSRTHCHDLDGARRAAEQGAAGPIARHGTERVLTLRLRALSAWLADRPGEASAAFDEALQQCEASCSDPHYRFDLLIEKLAMYLLFGEIGHFEATLDRIDTLAARLPYEARFSAKLERYARFALVAPFCRVMLAVMRGDFEQAERRRAALVEQRQRLELAPVPDGVQHTLLLVLQQGMYQGTAVKWRSYLEARSATHPEEKWHLSLLLARCAIEAGELDNAQRHYQVARDTGFRASYGGCLSRPGLGTLMRVADLCTVVGDPRDAATLYDRLRAFEDKCAFDGFSVMGGSLHRPLGELAQQLGRHERARAHLERAVRANREMGATPERLRAQAALGRAMGALGRASEARALRAGALAEAEELGIAAQLLDGARRPS